jgi:nanoRNase/pAp phosphatase (c-di-AMP/oligoRNAs hydrolase)
MSKIKPEEVDLVIYHGNCPDGFGAAWAAWKLLGDKAEYVPAYHGMELPDVTGKTVAFIDFCPKDADELAVLESATKGLIVIDHHQTAEEACGHMDCTHFDMSHSGCVLSWNFFHPGKEVPAMLSYIEDRDLYTWKIEDSESFLAQLDSFPMSFHGWDAHNTISSHDDGLFEMTERGKDIVRYKNMVVEDVIRQATPVEFNVTMWEEEDEEWVDRTYKIMAVNCGDRFVISKACNRLAEESGLGIAMAWRYNLKEGTSLCSLRSIGDIDVAAIAEAFTGGGGHKNAAGFTYKGMISDLMNSIEL